MASLEALQPATVQGWKGECSPTCSNQTDKNNCRVHVLTKILMKNAFEQVLDLRLTPVENDRYDLCMPLLVPPRLRGYIFTPGRYPMNAEKKVKLFYYLFSLLEYKKQDVSDALSLLDMPLDAPVKKGKVNFSTIQYVDDEVLLGMREEFLAKSKHLLWKHVHLQMDDIEDFDMIKTKVLEPILALNLYFEMGLVEKPKSEDEVPKRHIVLITGFDKDTIHIKNTWGTLLHKVAFGDTIKLEDGDSYEVTDLHTILPMVKKEGAEETGEFGVRDLDAIFTFVEDYVSSYPSIFKGGKSRKNRKSRKRKSKRRIVRIK